MSFGKCVKEIRGKLKLSQQALADALGVSFSTVNRWENDKHKPSKMAIHTVEAFCQSKKIDFNFKFGEED